MRTTTLEKLHYRASASQPRNHLIVVRHGESCANTATDDSFQSLIEGSLYKAVDRIWRGRFFRQPMLTIKGAKQAYGTGKWLKQCIASNAFTRITSVESSVLPRAAMTAAFIISQLDIEETLTKDMIPTPKERTGKVVKIIPHFEEHSNILDRLMLGSGKGTQNTTTLESLTAFLHSIHHIVKILCQIDVYFIFQGIDKNNLSGTSGNGQFMEDVWNQKLTDSHGNTTSTVVVSHGHAMASFIHKKLNIKHSFPNCGMILYEPWILPINTLNFNLKPNPPPVEFPGFADAFWNDYTQYPALILSCNYKYNIHIKPISTQFSLHDIRDYRTSINTDDGTWFYKNWKVTSKGTQVDTSVLKTLHTFVQNIRNSVQMTTNDDLETLMSKPLPHNLESTIEDEEYDWLLVDKDNT